ncbi:uncharacterized protein LOC112904807 [Agrilus planipennis]|uniref:Uncharacterized protein LOC112904807 n=1 Tax=Agrilus planipennis TaxID=224129 RepID=A0A7F5R6J9_AGRPL|nr:uncharacterized protein LOC112904807 [Agrilus planipennis]
MTDKYQIYQSETAGEDEENCWSTFQIDKPLEETVANKLSNLRKALTKKIQEHKDYIQIHQGTLGHHEKLLREIVQAESDFQRNRTVHFRDKCFLPLSGISLENLPSRENRNYIQPEKPPNE